MWGQLPIFVRLVCKKKKKKGYVKILKYISDSDSVLTSALTAVTALWLYLNPVTHSTTQRCLWFHCTLQMLRSLSVQLPVIRQRALTHINTQRSQIQATRYTLWKSIYSIRWEDRQTAHSFLCSSLRCGSATEERGGGSRQAPISLWLLTTSSPAGSLHQPCQACSRISCPTARTLRH